MKVEPVALLPCQFCGGEVNFHGTLGDEDCEGCHNICCTNCGLFDMALGDNRNTLYGMMAVCAARWNKRVIPPGYSLVPVEQVKDAERYAYLREDCPWTILTEVFSVPLELECDHEANKIALDECIDAAILPAAKEE